MIRLERIRSRPRTVAVTCALALVGATAFAVAEEDAVAQARTTVDLPGSPNTPPTVIDLGSPGRGEGDLYVFASRLVDAEGATIGAIRGTQTAIRFERGVQTMQGSITFELADGQIAVGGLSEYPSGGPAGTTVGQPFVRPVLGGTGRYRAARGTLTTTQQPNGTYDHRFDLDLSDATAPGRRLTLVADGPRPTHVDVGAADRSQGDIYVVAGRLIDSIGHVVGRVRGTQTSLERPGDVEHVGSALTFTLAPRGTIVVGGLADYPTDGLGTVVGREMVRPVLGGTGRFAGVKGTLTTTLHADGAYQHRFDLVDAPKPSRTVRLIAGRGQIVSIDLGTPGSSPGDLFAFGSDLFGGRGQTIGRVRGTQMTIRHEQRARTVVAQMSYELTGRGQIVVGGQSQYPRRGRAGTVVGRTFVRPVLGGTGEFDGARGTLTSTQWRNGSYRHVFRLSR